MHHINMCFESTIKNKKKESSNLKLIYLVKY